MKSHRKNHFHKRMALQTDNPPTTPSAQVVGNAFIEQYYLILHHSPELVFRFYKDSSVLCRPDSNGVMTSVTTMQGIKKKIISFDYKNYNYKTEIKTADAQQSYQGGLIVLVTGCLMGKGNLRRKFAQTFFLALQDNGYFVLNDIFRYVEDGEPLENQPINGTDDAPRVHSVPDPEPTHIPDLPAPDPATTVEQGLYNVVEKAYDQPTQGARNTAQEEIADTSKDLEKGNGPAMFSRSKGEKEKEEDDEEESTEEEGCEREKERNGEEEVRGEETSLLLKGPSTTELLEATPLEEGTITAEPTINNPAEPVVKEVATSDPPIQPAQDLDPASPSTLKEKEEVERTLEPTDFKPAFPVPPTTVEVSGSVKSISDSALWSSSMKERLKDLICLISGRTRIHHSSSTTEISSMSTIPNPEEINGAFEALKTLLDKPAVEVFNNPDDRDQCRQLMIMLSSHHTSLEKRIILDNFSSRLPEFEKKIPAAVSTRESALGIRDSNLPRANELDSVLEQGKATVSSLQYKFDELTQRHDTLTEQIRKLETDRDQVQGSITETAAQLENLHQKLSSDYKASEALQQQTINAGKDFIHAENIIAEREFAFSTLRNRLFPFSS